MLITAFRDDVTSTETQACNFRIFYRIYKRINNFPLFLIVSNDDVTGIENFEINFVPNSEN